MARREQFGRGSLRASTNPASERMADRHILHRGLAEMDPFSSDTPCFNECVQLIWHNHARVEETWLGRTSRNVTVRLDLARRQQVLPFNGGSPSTSAP